ncbi:MAG: SdrD B-like domain-containing protein [bacterium]
MRNCSLLLIPLLLGLVLVGCSDDSSIVPTTSEPSAPTNELALSSAIPHDVVLESATLHIWVNQSSGNEVFIHRGYDPWSEYAVTWNGYIGGWVPDVSGSFMADGVGWRSSDITDLVQDWFDGFYPNFGFVLNQDECAYPQSNLASRESGGHVPYLEICYYSETGGVVCETFASDADAFIWQAYPDSNFGNWAEMTIGCLDQCTPEARAMLFFDLPIDEQQAVAIGDLVWHDDNCNGLQDYGEAGVPGVTVYLYDCYGTYVATTTTDAAGLYHFEDLTPGSYYVKFSLPAGYTFSPRNQGSNDNIDSDAGSDGKTQCIFLEPCDHDNSWDAGLCIDIQYAAIGDYVWHDVNENGIQDPGEPGLAGIVVDLFTCAGSPVAQMLTDNDGYYEFNQLPEGEYYLHFTLPAGWTFTGQDQGGDDAKDSDVGANGRTVCTLLDGGEVDHTWDAGMYEPDIVVSLGDWVWYDGNQNGIQDPGEPGVEGILVNLYTCVDELVASGFTDSDGHYFFADLDTGCYFVEFILPDTLEFTIAGATMDDGNDSDADPTTGRTECTCLLPGESDLTWDAGVYKPCERGELGDYVWFDTNHNGVQESGEGGLQGVEVTLYDCHGMLKSMTVTDGAGFYWFGDLMPGGYVVFFDAPDGYVFSPQGIGDNSQNSDPDPMTGMTDCLTLYAGQTMTTVDAGMYTEDILPAAIGDRVWHDLNQNGLKEMGEPGLAGVQVTLYNCHGVQVDQMLTDASGYYLFNNLTPGEYNVGFVPPEGYLFSPRNVGYNDAIDSDPHPTTGLTACTYLSPGETDVYWDAGMYQYICEPEGSIGDRVWYDDDHDGLQDPGETGISGIQVTLYNCVGAPINTTTTDGGGFYLFDGLDNGAYAVGFALPNGYVFSPRDVGGNDAVDSDADPSTGTTACTNIVSDMHDMTWDAGMYQPVYETASIGDRVWYDDNENGIQDAGEPGIAGIPVTLYACDGYPLAEMRTDANGNYVFTDLEPGSYLLGFRRPRGFVFSPMRQGGNQAADSDVDPATGLTECTVLSYGENDRTWDAGLYESPYTPVQRTIGYWKNHSGFGPQDDVVTPLLPLLLGDAGGTASLTITSAAEAVDILEMKTLGRPSNGITKLYAQLLASKLNLASGTGDEGIAGVITEADEFLAAHSWTEWDQLSQATQNQILAWKDSCDRFNNGAEPYGM